MPNPLTNDYDVIVVSIGSAHDNKDKSATELDHIMAGYQQYPVYARNYHDQQNQSVLIINIDPSFAKNVAGNDINVNSSSSTNDGLSQLVTALQQENIVTIRNASKELDPKLTFIHVKAILPTRYMSPKEEAGAAISYRLFGTNTINNATQELLHNLILNHCLQNKKAVIHTFISNKMEYSSLNFEFVQKLYDKLNEFQKNLIILAGYFNTADNLQLIKDINSATDAATIVAESTKFFDEQQKDSFNNLLFLDNFLANSDKVTTIKPEHRHAASELLLKIGWNLLPPNPDLTANHLTSPNVSFKPNSTTEQSDKEEERSPKKRRRL